MSAVFRNVLLGLAIVFSGVSAAWAHPAPFSYLDIVFKEGGIEGTLVVHVIDVAHELSVLPEKVMEPGFAEAQQNASRRFSRRDSFSKAIDACRSSGRALSS